MECQCCFTDTPINRAINCDSETAHFFCFTCVRNYATTEIGMMRYKMTCFDGSGCKVSFSQEQLRLALDHKTLDRLDHLQQQDEIKMAEFEGLSECPFCDFKAICPAVEVDREFRCYNPNCEKVSCRLCNEETHIPRTCEEAKKDKGLPARHQVEEAMSEALIRACPRCKTKIVKEDGCNKMVCTKCQCMMCYVCKADITGRGPRKGYEHFHTGPNGCPVHDFSGQDRHRVSQILSVFLSRFLRLSSEIDSLLHISIVPLTNDTIRKMSRKLNNRPSSRSGRITLTWKKRILKSTRM